jgi:hypothetical protein
MKNKTLSISFLLAPFALLCALLAAPPAHAVQGRPSAITFVDTDNDRRIYAFVKGDNGHLVASHYNGTDWTWTDHGLPEGVASINSPKAVTYFDDSGKRRIYVFAVDNTGHLVVRYHKGAGYDWAWSKQGGPHIIGMSLSATTFEDDNGVRRIDVFALRTNTGAMPYRLVRHFWNGNSWNWYDLAFDTTHTYNQPSFTEVTNYKDTDGRRRMDVFSAGGDSQKLLRHSWLEGVWTLTNLGGQADRYATVVNYKDSYGNADVHTFAKHPAYLTIWEHSGAWGNRGIPSAAIGEPMGFISATAYKDSSGFPRINLFAEWDKRLYVRSWINLSWQPWLDLGLPSSSQTEGVENTAAITYLDSRGGDQYTWVFMTGAQDNLYVNWWNGSSWQWYNRGNP